MVDDAGSTHPDSQSYIFTSISAVKVNAKSFSMTGKRTVAVVVITHETDNRREREERESCLPLGLCVLKAKGFIYIEALQCTTRHYMQRGVKITREALSI